MNTKNSKCEFATTKHHGSKSALLICYNNGRPGSFG